MNSPKPVLIHSVKEMQTICRNLSQTIGFVPTMGYLHEGHLSLVKAAKDKAEIVIVSIYVNPTQFSPNEDLSSYPRDPDRDIQLLSELDVDYIFFPSNEEMYPAGFKTWVAVEEITQILCGKSRSTHFKGVTTIVAKLMNIIDPDFMLLGEKDFQQLKVLQQMGKDLNFSTEIIGCPLIREKDGLAMSSRNKYLSPQERKDALCLHNSLLLAQKLFSEGMTASSKIIAAMRDLIVQNKGRIDYIEVIDTDSLESLDELRSGCRIVLAVYIGKTRLIDNVMIKYYQ
ncbi:MAG: pantoate--beta-alanine ligase [Candidatus Cloacimonadales bacterium]|nr:pantoate--beta-alanine ligase [Candidatus Cloacimonadales bacterium]